MCGRYRLTRRRMLEIEDYYGVDDVSDLDIWERQFNIPPREMAPIVCEHGGHTRCCVNSHAPTVIEAGRSFRDWFPALSIFLNSVLASRLTAGLQTIEQEISTRMKKTSPWSNPTFQKVDAGISNRETGSSRSGTR